MSVTRLRIAQDGSAQDFLRLRTMAERIGVEYLRAHPCMLGSDADLGGQVPRVLFERLLEQR